VQLLHPPFLRQNTLSHFTQKNSNWLQGIKELNDDGKAESRLANTNLSKNIEKYES